eukprot:gb/GECH01014699.1/.p1 GENE.gb/GECH01014699.1/~~gb/GECH01014699.1/.p1  ORF type:complete len:305 (+),score=61.60 gb/GECH01014699.1/:1-915(+)
MGGCLSLLQGLWPWSESLEIKGKKYYIQERIGEGGFSFVFKVLGAHDSKEYAVKRLFVHENEQKQLARWEINVHNAFNHDNVMPLIDHDFIEEPDNSQALLLMPYYDDGTLSHWLAELERENRHIPERLILQIFQQICSAVQCLHQHEPAWAHYDIKPLNVLLWGNRRCAVLTDFGSAQIAYKDIRNHKDAVSLQDTAEQFTSMAYRAPELFTVPSPSVIDTSVDIWSLGCTLYAMAFYHSPFEVTDGSSVKLAVMNARYPFPANNPYSEPFCQLITDTLCLKPSDRPSIDTLMERVTDLHNNY